MKKYYYLGRCHCDCHVEICDCNKHAIYYGIKEHNSEYIDRVYSTFFDKKMAIEFCEFLNKRE